MITRLDHLVLTVSDISKTIAFYTKVLGMREMTFSGGRRALSFGEQKINLHEKGREFEPKAACPTTGSADLCFLSDTALSVWFPSLSRMAWRFWKARFRALVPAGRSFPSIFGTRTAI
jgi:catechol 2,3-dioxygenase-like lactoylglutathione lyase family enzyme